MTKNELNGWVLFSATWCGPCKNIKSDIAKLSEEQQKLITIIYYEDNKDLFTELGVRTVPQFHLIQNGNSIESHIGIPAIPNKIQTLFGNGK
jgi:thiol-disulfide isomerase/thioredoxin